MGIFDNRMVVVIVEAMAEYIVVGEQTTAHNQRQGPSLTHRETIHHDRLPSSAARVCDHCARSCGLVQTRTPIRPTKHTVGRTHRGQCRPQERPFGASAEHIAHQRQAQRQIATQVTEAAPQRPARFAHADQERIVNRATQGQDQNVDAENPDRTGVIGIQQTD